MESEFIVGIDLGTTNSALSYCAAADESGQIAVENIPQLANPNEVATAPCCLRFSMFRAKSIFRPAAWVCRGTTRRSS